MSKDLEILQEFDTAYEAAYLAWNPFYPLAADDLRFYEGIQWDEQERQNLISENRNAFVFNRIKKNINLVTGYQRKNRLSSVVIPQENQDQLAADQLSQLLLYAMNKGEGYQEISNAFEGACKTGWNLLDIYMDYTDDPVNGDIKFGRTPYSGFICDPYFTRLDLSDCSFVIKRKYLSPEQVASLLPEFEDEVYSLVKFGWSRDDKFPWLPYQTNPSGVDLMAYNEMYLQKWKKVPIIIDEETGEFTEWEGPKEQLREFVKKFPQLSISSRPKKYIEKHIIVNDAYIKTEMNPYGLNEYPFVPFVGYFDPEGEFWGQKLQSLVRCMVDPQREANRRRSQMIDILDSQINSGWIADEDSVINPQSLFQTSQGKVIWRSQSAKPNALEKIPASQIPPSMFQLQELFDRDMTEILGLNDAAFGVPESGNESGIMMMLRQGSAITNLQGVFDNLRYAQKLISMKAVKLILTWMPAKMARILNQQPSPQLFEKDFTKFDISIQEGMLTDTQKQIYFRQLVDLKQLGAPVTGEMLAKAAPIQGKTEYIQEITQAEEQQRQAAMQQQQLQMQYLQSRAEKDKASAISDVALSKERFARAKADLGLQDERQSEAIQNRAQATLDRAKAIKELESMDDDRLIKYLNIVTRLGLLDEAKEDKEKQDDDFEAATGTPPDLSAPVAGIGQQSP